jgi:flagellar export protein FliJ
MDARRQAALRLLERLKRQELEEYARDIGELRGRMAELEQRIDGLQDDLREKARVESIEAAPYVGDYIRSVRSAIAGLESESSELQPQIETLEDALRERFREMKTFEIIREHGAAQEKAERDRKESQESEEQVILRWQR